MIPPGSSQGLRRALNRDSHGMSEEINENKSSSEELKEKCGLLFLSTIQCGPVIVLRRIKYGERGLFHMNRHVHILVLGI